jgi:diguanylate cyclase (GGDEF)-like protein/PAS domain S-box-containing protein
VSNISPILRLSIGLILLTISLLLIGDMLGLTPDPKRAELAARKAIAEALAVQVSQGVADDQVTMVGETIQALQERNETVLSVALRTSDGRLLAMAGDHLKHWQDPGVDRSTSSHVQVPIYGEAGRWGVLEVSFEPLDGIFFALFRGGSIAAVILFIGVVGFVTYWLFLKRALNELDPTSVVPDRVRAALDVLAEGLVLLDRRGRIVLVNAAFQKKLGQSAKSLVGNELSALRWEHSQRREGDEKPMYPWKALFAGEEMPSGVQLKLRTAMKQDLVFGVNVSPIKEPNGGIRGAVVTFDDLTELERKNGDLERALGRLERSQREITRQNRELQVLATRDPLTGCLNRRSLFEGMETLLREAAEDGEPLSCIMADIDHFKSINDRFGHATGDKVIKLLAQILVDTSRAEDLVGRYGGEEFCIILPGVDERHAADIAERMRLALYDGKQARFTTALRISASFGVSSDDSGQLTPGALVDLADKALYQAKERGRNRVIRYSLLDRSVTAKPPHEVATPTAPAPSAPADTMLAVALDEHTERLQARIVELERLILEQGGELSTHKTDEEDLPSRLVVLDRIKQAIQRSQRSRTELALMSIEIDTVQLVRNTLGEGSAEKLQRIVSRRVRDLLRATDTVSLQGADQMGLSLSRTGTGELVVLLADMRDAESVTWIVPRVLAAMRDSIELDGSEFWLDARIGVSLFPRDGEDPDTLLAHAAAAAREAKAAPGRNVCLYYSENMNLRAREQLHLESQLHRAIERGELYLDYQPVVDLSSGRMSGFEALLRWRHPEMGFVPPDRFVPVAEHAGLIEEIGEWVLKSAMRQLKAWHDAGDEGLSVAVNFSAVQFRNPNLVERIVSIVRGAGLSPSSLVVEITESALIQNLESAVAIVAGLTKAGVRVALDDFGTGYSSLGYLKRFSIDAVKIDRSFLHDFPAHPHDTEIVSAIIAMAHSLGLRVVAEGVEDDRQLQVLKSLGCDEVQGYLISRPVSPQHAAALLANPTNVRRLVWAAGEHGDRAGTVRESPVSGVLNEPPYRGVAL